ncbi:hypothetical protein IU459_31590 [Nocardia amamiensis]|uniref:TIR domain-containing protein n=1 Tax=Nocardia amamiensis TaxID=404578 RepID=A0ABS0CZV5_9NOCA|nr:hypothetical protein [Nocardia amamiensis]MBF6302055.1 hypothetical protein [Nocardia amamiensis]
MAETIIRLHSEADAPLNAYWLSLVGDRDEYAAQLGGLLSEHGLGVLIVRNNGFTNANALMVDLVELLEHNRAVFLTSLQQPRAAAPRMGIVLLARRELAMGQAYSPVTWPEWVPGVGNRETTCFITDVTRRIEVPLSAEEIDLARIHRALFAVEEAMVRRLLHVHRRSPDAQHAFFQSIRRRSDPSWTAFLAGAREAISGFRTPQAYRPEVRAGKSVVSRLWGLSMDTPPARLATVQTELAAALHVADDAVWSDRWEGLMTVLARPTVPPNSPATRLCRCILSTVPTACQFITCAAHAGEYYQFPVNLLTAVVDDLHWTLTHIETSLIHLSDDRATRALS